MTKRCSSCKGVKSSEEFYPSSSARDGYQPQCKACHRESTQRDYRYAKEDIIMRVLEWQVDNAEKVRAYKRKYKEYEKKQRQINRARKENSSGDS